VEAKEKDERMIEMNVTYAWTTRKKKLEKIKY
jgi:hypothetical protein